MRNLKRVLSLALAVVMVIGMMVVSTSAASINDFGDKAEIKNQEAVGLLVDLGVIQGGNDGNFAPNGTLTRGQFAKIAYLLANTQTDFGRYAGTGIAKDAAGHWAEGALVWCNTWRNQIITGGNDGNFYPEDTLTVVQCAVMMLRVLGYNNYLEGFTGNGWEIRTLNKADEVGLMVGLEDLKASDPISRDDACLMAYNALFANTVRHTEQWDPTAKTMVPNGYETIADADKKSLAETTFKVEAITAVVKAIADNGNVTAATVLENGNLAAAAVVSKLTATPDMVGTTITYYTKGSDVLTVAADPAAKVVATIDGSEYSTKVGTENNKTYKTDGPPDVYTNGKAGAVADIKTGSVVELISNDADDKIEVVRVTNKTVATLSADPKLSTDGKKVEVAGILSAATKIENVKGYEGLKKGDVVLYHSIGGVTYIEKTEKVTGKITAISANDEYTVNGSKLSASKLNPPDMSDANFKDEFDFFLDNGGNIVAFALAGEAPAKPEVKYAVTMDFGYTTTGQTGAIGAESSTTYQVKLLFTDGTSEIVDMVGYTKKDGTVYGLTAKAAADGNPEVTAFTADIITNATTGLKAANKGHIVSYTVANGKYTVTEVGSDITADSAVNGGKAAFITGSLGNKDTIFLALVGTGEDATLKVYKGVAELPSATGTNKATAGQVFTPATGTFATLAYLEINALDGAKAEETAYFIDNNKYTVTANGYEVQAIVDGEIKTLVVDAKHWTSANSGNNVSTASGLNKVTYTDGKVTNAVAATGFATKSNVKMAAEFVTDGTDYWTVGADTVIYKITTNARGTTASKVELSKLAEALKATDDKVYTAVIKVDATDDTLIDTMYITVDACDGTLTYTAGTGNKAGMEHTGACAKCGKTVVEECADRNANGKCDKCQATMTVTPFATLATEVTPTTLVENKSTTALTAPTEAAKKYTKGSVSHTDLTGVALYTWGAFRKDIKDTTSTEYYIFSVDVDAGSWTMKRYNGTEASGVAVRTSGPVTVTTKETFTMICGNNQAATFTLSNGTDTYTFTWNPAQ